MQYRPHADATFQTEIKRDFHARFWEMYLICTLLEYGQKHGYAVSCPKHEKAGGPDILVERDGFRIWIEAITATDGDSKKADSVIKSELGKVHSA